MRRWSPLSNRRPTDIAVPAHDLTMTIDAGLERRPVVRQGNPGILADAHAWIRARHGKIGGQRRDRWRLGQWRLDRGLLTSARCQRQTDQGGTQDVF